jgi:hypothetical protein
MIATASNALTERKLTYYMVAKFTTDTSVLKDEAESFIRLAINGSDQGSDVQLFQMGELLID